MTKAQHRMEQVQTYLKSILHEHQEILSKTKLTYFQKTLKNGTDYQSSIAFLRFIKPFLPSDQLSVGPTVSQSFFSNWLDYKNERDGTASYIKNSFTIIKELKQLHIPKEARLFSVDATSMYTNIDMSLGVKALKDFIKLQYKEKLPSNFPMNLFIHHYDGKQQLVVLVTLFGYRQPILQWALLLSVPLPQFPLAIMRIQPFSQPSTQICFTTGGILMISLGYGYCFLVTIQSGIILNSSSKIGEPSNG